MMNNKYLFIRINMQDVRNVIKKIITSTMNNKYLFIRTNMQATN